LVCYTQAGVFETVWPDEPFWDIAAEHLKKVDEKFWFELSRDRHPAREFIVTAEGHASSFPLAEELVRLAPITEGWAFIALKPAQGFRFTTDYEGTRFDPRQMWFLPLENESRPGDLGLKIAIPGLDAMDKSLAHTAVLVVLDTGLGERSAALDLQYTEVTDVPADPSRERLHRVARVGPTTSRGERSALRLCQFSCGSGQLAKPGVVTSVRRLFAGLVYRDLTPVHNTGRILIQPVQFTLLSVCAG